MAKGRKRKKSPKSGSPHDDSPTVEEPSPIPSAQDVKHDEDADDDARDNENRETKFQAELANQIAAVIQSAMPTQLSTSSSSDPPSGKSEDRPYKCTLCDKCYKSYGSLWGHLNIHKEKFKCHVCSKCCESQKDLNYHIKAKHSENKKEKPTSKPFVCEECGSGYASKLSLTSHMYVHQERFKCQVCGKCFASKKDLNNHVEAKHTEKKPKPKEKPYKCPDCGRGYYNKRSLRGHKHVHLGTFKCEVCDPPKCFPSQRELIKHYFKHSDEKTFNCDLCWRRYKYERSLAGHKHVHLGTYKCVVCNPPRCFPTNQDLAIHKTGHDGETPFKCDECSKYFQALKHLKLHIKTHRKAFQCDDCGKRFSSQSQLTHHSVVHTGIRQYLCHVCAKQFFTITVLRRHLETHEPGYLPKFPCDICGHKFRSPKILKAHQKIHRKGTLRYCKYCSRGFATYPRLRQHLGVAHKTSRNYKCDQCPAAFSHKYGLDKHQRNVHNGKLQCEFCEMKYTDPSTLRRHQRKCHDIEKTRECRFRQHECIQCTPHKAFPNQTSLVTHRIYNHPNLLCPTENGNPYELVDAAAERVYFGSDKDLRQYVQEAKAIHCLKCGHHFTEAKFLEEHLKRNHHLASRQVQMLDMKNAFEEVAKCYQDDKVNELFELSKRLAEQHDGNSKIYKLLFVPIEIKKEDIKKEIQAGNKRILVYNGKLSQHIGLQKISSHHTHDAFDPVSTNLLMAVANRVCLTYYCVHFSDVWTPRDLLLTSGQSIAKVEVLEIFISLLFSIKYEQDMFFQHLDFGLLKEVLTYEILLDCIRVVEDSGGNLLKMKNMELKFIRDVNIETSHVKDDRLQFSKCKHCPDAEPFLSRHHAIKHQISEHPNMDKQSTLSPLKRLLLLKELEPEAIMDIIQSCDKKQNCCVYAMVAVPGHPKSQVLDTIRTTNGCRLYVGQNTAGIVSTYHFSKTSKSSVRKMKNKESRIFLVRKWFCASSRDMYRLESALIIIGHLRRLFQTDEQKNSLLTIVNKIVQIYDLAEKFTVEEFKSIYECAARSDSILDIDLPEFLKFKTVVDYEEDLTDQITGIGME